MKPFYFIKVNCHSPLVVFYTDSLRSPTICTINNKQPFVSCSVPHTCFGLYKGNHQGGCLQPPYWWPKTQMRTRNISLGVKATGALGWHPYHLHVPKVLKSESDTLGTLNVCPELSRVCCTEVYGSYPVKCGGRGGTGAALQIGRSLVRFQMVSLEFFIDTILPIALWPWGRLSL
jgi:hypothetical protein